jgi:hypothetical protein
MHWYFRDISDDPSEKELTQQDQFNNDEVALAEALVRETIQNSTDAQASSGKPVNVRFALTTVTSPIHKKVFREILDGLIPHLKECGISTPKTDEALRLLVVEDFGTTGLTGSVENKDNGHFSGFWRRFGRSNKQGAKGGRWGLGKLVFPSSSLVKIVIGLTRRQGENHTWVMGQAVLRNHSINGHECDSVGFWCRSQKRKGWPTDDPRLCATLTEAAGLKRQKEAGLSLIVPYILPDIDRQLLIASVIKNYYFPILTGRLIVEIDGSVISAETFDAVASKLSADAVSSSVLNFVRELQERRHQDPHLSIPIGWQSKEISAEYLEANQITALRERFSTGEMLMIRAPVTIKNKDGQIDKTYVDLFLKNARPGEKTQTLVVRGAITVPTEGKRMTFADSHAALIADDEAISRMLGDAENPAHTQWNERAEKLRLGWQGGGLVLRRIRSVLREIHDLIVERIERNDPFALLDFFSIPKSGQVTPAHRVAIVKPQDFPPPQPKAFRIEKRIGGFAILPGPGLQKEKLPTRIKVRCAYDVLSGNPFRRFSEYDFSFYSVALKIDKKNADYYRNEPNEIDIEIRDLDFKVDVVGFDPNRDLIIEAQG